MHYSETCIKLTPMGLQGLSAHNLFFFTFHLKTTHHPKNFCKKIFNFNNVILKLSNLPPFWLITIRLSLPSGLLHNKEAVTWIKIN